MKAFLIPLKRFIGKFWDDILELFFDDKTSAAAQDFILNNFAITFLINSAGLLILLLIIVYFHREIKNGVMPLSLNKKISLSKFRTIFIGCTVIHFLIFVCVVASMIRIADVSDVPSQAESLLVVLYLLEWLTLLLIGLIFFSFSIVWTVGRFRDMGESSWKVILMFVPLLNLFFLYNLLFKKGTSNSEEDSPSDASHKFFSFFAAILGVPLLIFIMGTGALEYNDSDDRKISSYDLQENSVQLNQEPLTSSGIFIGTANRNDFYLLPETFSGDEKNFRVTVEYIDKDENQKGTVGYFFIYNPVGWIYYDTIDESRKNYVSKLKDGDVVKNIWQYCYENLVIKSPPPSEQNEYPKKKPMYRYPSQHNNGTYVWAGYMKGFGCYLDTNSIHVFDNTSDYKDWEQVVKIYDEDNFVNSVTQNFHWDPQNGACVGGRGISKITDRNLMYQFETGWQYAFGYRYNQ